MAGTEWEHSTLPDYDGLTSDVSTMAGVMPPCRDEAIRVGWGGLRTFGSQDGRAQWEHSPILLRLLVGCCTQPHCWQNLCAFASQADILAEDDIEVVSVELTIQARRRSIGSILSERRRHEGSAR